MNPWIKLPAAELVLGRQGFVLDRCAGKRVLHIGCVDSGLLEGRFEAGTLMHQRLAGVAGELWGVDVDGEGVSYLRERGVENLVVGDVCERETLERLAGNEFDVLVATELIEHLSNPGMFLEAAKVLMARDGAQLIASVPNAFRVDTLMGLLRGIEYVHPDHNYWFSCQTFSHLLTSHGLNVEELAMYVLEPLLCPRLSGGQRSGGSGGEDSGSSGAVRDDQGRGLGYYGRVLRRLPRWALASLLCTISPYWGDGLIVVARLPEES